MEELETAALVPLEDDEATSSPPPGDFNNPDVEMTDKSTWDDRPSFPALKNTSSSSRRFERRKIAIPPHRMTPLKREWPQIYPPLIEYLKLQVRMNPARKVVEIRTTAKSGVSGTPAISTAEAGAPETSAGDAGAALQKGEDFIRAFALGFEVADAIALLRMDDLYVETFEIKDVKTLQGDHLARAIGRIAGKDGKTKIAIENASRTRVVLADSKIHILGRFKNIHMARESIVDLIRGKQPGKVYGNLQRISKRLRESF